MYCNVEYLILEDAPYSERQVQASINECVFQNSLAQLMWLKDHVRVSQDTLEAMGIYMDFRVIKQAECLLSVLAELYPKLKITISGRYAAYPLNLRKPWCDDMGGFFQVVLENGAIHTDDTPII